MMHSINCPQCKATLDADAYRRSGTTTCPFCSTPLPFEALAAADDDHVQPGTTADGDHPHEDLWSGSVFEEASALAPLPGGSRIQIIESSADRHVILIPPGGKNAQSLGCFALFWNGFLSFFTPAMLLAFTVGPPKADQPPVWGLLLFLGVFWAVGLGMAWLWVRMRFTRYLVLLEPHRFVLQRSLFGRKKIEEVEFDGGVRAELVESYSQNKRPVHCVAVNGGQRPIKFGTSLSPKEKSWLRDAINRHLGLEPLPEKKPPQSLDELLERNSKPAPAISPYDAADSREIELLEQSPEKLSYSYPLFPPGRVRSVISTILTGILTLWWGFAAVLFASSLTGLGKAGPNALPLILPLMLVIPSMPLALILLVVTRGRTTVSITRDQLSCRRHLGALGWTRKADVGRIRKVQTLQLGGRLKNRPENPTAPGAPQRFHWESCIVATADGPIVLTTGHSPETTRHAGGLLRHQLQQWGYALHDE